MRGARRYFAAQNLSNDNIDCYDQMIGLLCRFRPGGRTGKMLALITRQSAMRSKSKKPDTLLAHAGRAPEKNFGVVNPPVYHASTILHRTVAEYEASGRNRYNQVTYGRHGTPTTFALEEAVAAIEGGHRAVACCSGVAACFASILAFVKAGDHILVVDTVYGPVRAFCTGFLTRFGVETTFYDPLVGAGIAALFRPNTVLVYLES